MTRKRFSMALLATLVLGSCGVAAGSTTSRDSDAPALNAPVSGYWDPMADLLDGTADVRSTSPGASPDAGRAMCDGADNCVSF